MLWLFARYAYVPFMMVGLVGLALCLIANGAPVWITGSLAVIAVGLTFLMERIAPYEQTWNGSHGDVSKDVAHGIAYEAGKFLAMLLLPAIAMINPGEGIWPLHWPLWGQLLLALLVADILMTLNHYVSHKVSWLWRLHSIHHGVHRLYGLNGLIRHPLHQAMDLTVSILPLILAGMPLRVAALLGFAITVQLLLQHANVDYALGPFQRFLAIGPLHRLHHVNWPGQGDVNFGLFLTAWDRILGTFRAAAERPPIAGDIGVEHESNYSQNYLTQLVLPFVPKRQPRAALARGSANPCCSYRS